VREEDISIFGLSSSSSSEEELSEELSEELLELSEEPSEELSEDFCSTLFKLLDSLTGIDSFWICSFCSSFFSTTISLSDSASDSEKTAVLFSLSAAGSASRLGAGCVFGSSGDVDNESEDESDQPSESNVTWIELSRTGFDGGFFAVRGETGSLAGDSSELDDSSEESLELVDIALFSSVIRSSTSRSLSLSILEDVSSMDAVSIGSIAETGAESTTGAGTTSTLRGPVTTGTVAESIFAIYPSTITTRTTFSGTTSQRLPPSRFRGREGVGSEVFTVWTIRSGFVLDGLYIK